MSSRPSQKRGVSSLNPALTAFFLSENNTARLELPKSGYRVEALVALRPTIMGSENRKQNRISLHRTETREQCRR